MGKRQRGWILWFFYRGGYGEIGGDNGAVYGFTFTMVKDKGGWFRTEQEMRKWWRVSFVPCRKPRSKKRKLTCAKEIRKIKERI